MNRYSKYKYAIEHRRMLQKLQHPPEVILVKEDDYTDKVAELEMVYGYGSNYAHMPGAHGWKSIVDDLPFPNPNKMRNPFQDGGYF
jgi:hypothetical protein